MEGLPACGGLVFPAIRACPQLFRSRDFSWCHVFNIQACLRTFSLYLFLSPQEAPLDPRGPRPSGARCTVSGIIPPATNGSALHCRGHHAPRVYVFLSVRRTSFGSPCAATNGSALLCKRDHPAPAKNKEPLALLAGNGDMGTDTDFRAVSEIGCLYPVLRRRFPTLRPQGAL